MPTVAELKSICKQNGIKNYSKLRKQELIDKCLTSKKHTLPKKTGKIYPPKKISHIPNKILLQGPMSIYILKSKKYHKTIVLLGEFHTNEKQYLCNNKSKFIPTSNYLEKLFKKTTEHIDFFIEMPYQKKEQYRGMKFWRGSSESELTAIGKIFDPCLSYNKEKCPYKNVYIHYTEIDKTDQHLRNMLNNTVRENYDNVISEFIGLIQEYKTIDKYTKHLLTTLKIQKQLDNIPSNIHNKLLSALYAYINTNKYALEHLNTKNMTTKDHAFIIFHYIRYLMDLYLLARMFRKFAGITQNNVIIYAGDTHIKRIHDILIGRLEFELVYKKRHMAYKPNFLCLDISDMPKTFFSNI